MVFRSGVAVRFVHWKLNIMIEFILGCLAVVVSLAIFKYWPSNRRESEMMEVVASGIMTLGAYLIWSPLAIPLALITLARIGWNSLSNKWRPWRKVWDTESQNWSHLAYGVVFLYSKTVIDIISVFYIRTKNENYGYIIDGGFLCVG